MTIDNSQIDQLLETLSDEEREEVLSILGDFVETGSSAKFKALIDKDFDEIPVDIETFIKDPQYLGGSYVNDAGKCIVYPFWIEKFKELFRDGKTNFNEVILTGAIGLGKAQPLTAKVLTPHGYVLMQDVEKGLTILDGDKKLCEVLEVFPQGKRAIYKVVFEDNTYIEVADNHLNCIHYYIEDNKIQDVMSTTKLYELWATQHNVYMTRYKSSDINDNNTKSILIADIILDRVDECQCIYVSSDKHTYITDNEVITHNTTIAVIGTAYTIYKLMCLKNPQQYYEQKPNSKIYVAFFNITLELSYGVAYKDLQEALIKSPWFSARGTVSGRKNLVYTPNKGIEFMVGSKPEHALGKNVFCLSGDTEVKLADNSYNMLRDIDSKINMYNVAGDLIEKTSKEYRSVNTKTTKNVIKLTLEDGTEIICSANHKFLMSNGRYKSASRIKPGDDFKEVKK